MPQPIISGEARQQVSRPASAHRMPFVLARRSGGHGSGSLVSPSGALRSAGHACHRQEAWVTFVAHSYIAHGPGASLLQPSPSRTCATCPAGASCRGPSNELPEAYPRPCAPHASHSEEHASISFGLRTHADSLDHGQKAWPEFGTRHLVEVRGSKL